MASLLSICQWGYHRGQLAVACINIFVDYCTLTSATLKTYFIKICYNRTLDFASKNKIKLYNVEGPILCGLHTFYRGRYQRDFFPLLNMTASNFSAS